MISSTALRVAGARSGRPPAPFSALESSPRVRLEEVREMVRENLVRVARRLTADGLPRPALDGKILRPLVAYLIVPEDRRGELDDRFWWGALAVEMVHEASLLHDDILDEAPERRGKPTLAASAGIGPALVLGDHLLTAAYRAAAAADSPEFLQVFIRAVERTVAGEIAQERAQGRVLEEAEYRRIVTGKSGELFRAAFYLGPASVGAGSPEAVGALGARLGCVYQMVDDFLDYCPDADRGKVPLQDLRQGKWTWPLTLVESEGFPKPESDILSRLFRRPASGDPAPMELGVSRIEGEVEALLVEAGRQGLDTGLLGVLLEGWMGQLRRSATREVARFSGTVSSGSSVPGAPALMEHPARPPWAGPADHALEPGCGGPGDHETFLAAAAAGLEDARARLSFFGRHARTFRFASRLFPGDALEKVAGVYAFCRFTDDLVDEADGADPEVVEGRLDAWLELSRASYRGENTGIPLLDQVLGTARAHEVPFSYVEELVEGVRMDIRPAPFESLEDLRVYSFRVASVVGGWLTELFGIRDPWVLERAFALGHAMQLTNILRDVGEDLRSGRIYLPLNHMARFGVDGDLLEAQAREGSFLFPGYRMLLEDLMTRADAEYDKAFRAIPALPSFFQGPVAVAARTYQAIHDGIRRNGYDNLTRRARTSLLRKLTVGARALLDLSLLKRKVARGGGGLEKASSPGRSGSDDPGIGGKARRRGEGQEAAA